MNPIRFLIVLLACISWPAFAQKAIPSTSTVLQTAAPTAKAPPVATGAPAAAPVLAPLPALPAGVMALPSGGSLRPVLPPGKLSTEMPQTGGSIQDTKARNMDMPTGRDNQQSILGEGGKIEPDKDGLIGGNVIKGGRYGDTFAGDKVNSQHRGDTNDFSGGGKGGQVSMIPGSGGGESGGGVQAAPTPSAGDSGGSSIPMSNGDNAGTANGVVSGGRGGKGMDGATEAMGRSVAARISGSPGASGRTPNTNVTKVIDLGSGNPKKREQEDAPSTGGGPMGRSDVLNAGRAIGGRTAAGSSGDGRGEVDAAPQGGGGGMMRAQGTAGAAEKEDKRGATVSMEQMLKINTQVNPGAR